MLPSLENAVIQVLPHEVVLLVGILVSIVTVAAVFLEATHKWRWATKRLEAHKLQLEIQKLQIEIVKLGGSPRKPIAARDRVLSALIVDIAPMLIGMFLGISLPSLLHRTLQIMLPWRGIWIAECIILAIWIRVLFAVNEWAQQFLFGEQMVRLGFWDEDEKKEPPRILHPFAMGISGFGLATAVIWIGYIIYKAISST